MSAEVQSYYPSRRKLLLLLAGCMVLLVGMGWILFDPTGVSLNVQLASWVGVPCLAIVALYLLVRLIRWRPSVRLDSAGIHEYASIFSAGFIRWTDIASVKVYSVGNGRLIGIWLKDNEKFLARLGPINRAVSRLGLSKDYPLIAIPENTVSVSADQLASEIAKRLNTNTP